MREQLGWSEDLSGDLQGSSEKSQPIDGTKEDAEARNDLWSIEGDFIDRHPVEHQVQLSVLKEETFPIPLHPDVLRESRIDDFWNVDADSLTGFTNEKCGPGERLAKIQKKKKKLPDLTICGQKYGPACQNQLIERNSIMRES